MLLGLILASVLLASTPAAAQDRLDAAALDRATAQPRAETAAVERMAVLLKLPPDAVRARKAGERLGWGDFFIAHRVAMRGAHRVEKVFAARRTGTGWSAIAEEANVSPDALMQDVAIVSPEAAKVASAPMAPPPAAATSTEEPKTLGAKIRDLFGGAPPPDDGKAASPANPAQEDIRDKMIRRGGRSR